MYKRRGTRTGVRFSASCLTDQGRVRKENQDACAADVKRGMFVVADGVGGAAAGERSTGKGRGKGREVVLCHLVLGPRQPKRQVEVKVEVENPAVPSFVVSSLVLCHQSLTVPI